MRISEQLTDLAMQLDQGDPPAAAPRKPKKSVKQKK